MSPHSTSDRISSPLTGRPGLSRGLILGVLLPALISGIALFPPAAQAQSSPLTIQPSTGYVGIGTTNPIKNLTVAGELQFIGYPTGLYLGNGQSIYDNAAAGLNISVPNAGSTLNISTNGGNISLNGGNVGIGTMSPEKSLQLYKADGTVPELKLTNTYTTHSPGVSNTAYIRFSGLRYPGGDNNVQDKFILGLRSGAINEIWDFVIRDTVVSADRVVINQSGNVGIGTTTPSSTLHVAGTITATVKNFQIVHPLDPENKVLVHSSLEGPEVGVYYRGEAQLEKGEAVVALPAYFEALTLKDQRTVQLTPVGGWSPLYVVAGVQSGLFTVRTPDGGNPSQRFYWEVKAVRADVLPIEVERVKPVEVKPQTEIP